METIKQFTKTLRNKIKNAIDEGDTLKANEIEANMLLSVVLLMVMLISIVCLIMNEIGIFTVEKKIMRLAILMALVVQVPIIITNKVKHGEPKWMKGLLEWGLLAVCEILITILGVHVTLVMVIPVLLSIRYCDVRFTRRVVGASILLFLIASIGNAYIGFVNLNVYKVEPGTVLTIETTLRNAVLLNGVDYKMYMKEVLINDYLPRLMAFSVIGFSSIKIANRGKAMIELQNEVSSKTARIETELNLANEIQTGMLPCIFPAFPDHGELELYAINTPAKEVGGDFYDYFKIDDNHVAIVMADVSGKGVGAALFMTISKIVIKNQLLSGKNPAEALTEANRQLCENNEAGLFVTTWAGVYDISNSELTYTNAGHNPPLVYNNGSSFEYLKGKNGIVLAGLDGFKYTESKVKLKKGDEIFLYTDGVTEATSVENKLYGEERLLACLNNHISITVKEQIEEIKNDILEFTSGAEQFDDITMMGMKIK